MTTDMAEQTIISGEWLMPDHGATYSEAFVGEIVDRWSGGVVFLATREVADAIVAAQVKQVEQFGDAAETLTWDGDALLIIGPDGTERVDPDTDGRYRIGWWTWYEVQADEVTGTIHG